MTDETDIHDKYKINDLPWEVSLPHGKYARIKIDQARALYRGMKMILEMINKYNLRPLMMNEDDKESQKAIKTWDEIIALLKKGIG